MGASRGGNPPNGNGCANRQSISHSSDDREQVQTARIDYNIDAKNMAWFRFQSDTGLQAAYTDPINPLFNAISPQPLYSFAAGYTHVFSGASGELLQSRRSPGTKACSGRPTLQKTLAAFPIVLQGSGANAPFTTLGGLDNTWVQGRRATRFFINDNLAWTVGAHELRFGTNSRIFRLNDYDFGEGAVPLVTYTTLPQFIYGVASTASETFPLADSQPYNFLNLDFYAQDTWKLTRTLTWTFGIRDTYNSNPLNPHDAVARLAGSFDSISHDVNQPLEPGDSRRSWATIFAATPAGDPAAANRHRLADRAAHGAAQRVRPVQRSSAGQRGRSGGRESAVLEDISGRAAGHGGRNGDRAGSSEQRHRRDRGGEPAVQLRLRARRSFPAPRLWRIRTACLPPISITAVPDGKLHAPYFMQWSFAVEHQIGNTLNLRAQYVGTRAVNQPYETQVNGYQTVCQGCFAPFPYGQPTDPRFGAGDAVEHRREQPLQRPPANGRQAAGARHSGPGELHLEPLHGHGLERRIPAVRRRSHSFAAAGRAWPPIRPLRLRRAAQLHRAVRLSIADQVPRITMLARALNGWQVSGTVFWHSGLPFSVLSAPYSANGNGIVQGSGPQYASVVPGVPLYEHNPIPGVTQPGTIQWLNPDAFVSAVDPSTGACAGGDSPANCQFGNLGRNALRGPDFVWSDLYLTKWFQLTERVKLRIDGQFFNVFNHPNFGLPVVVYAGIPGKPSTQTGFGALSYPTSPPTGLLGVGLGGDSSPRMIAFQARLEF